jgi:hypothetical protein
MMTIVSLAATIASLRLRLAGRFPPSSGNLLFAGVQLMGYRLVLQSNVQYFVFITKLPAIVVSWLTVEAIVKTWSQNICTHPASRSDM